MLSSLFERFQTNDLAYGVCRKLFNLVPVDGDVDIGGQKLCKESLISVELLVDPAIVSLTVLESKLFSTF